MGKIRNRGPAPQFAGVPCRDLISAILLRAVDDLKIDHEPEKAYEFLMSEDAKWYADLLELGEGCLQTIAEKLWRRYKIEGGGEGDGN